MLSQKRKFGNIGEEIACKFLLGKGHKILETNFQKRIGEIDIISELDGKLHFIEVKTRTKTAIGKFGLPQEAVNFYKRRKLIKTALFYLLESRRSENTQWQIDVIAITIDKEKRKARITFIKNAVDYDSIR